MSAFDALDARLAASVSRAFGDAIQWVPMRPLHRVTDGESEPDPSRAPVDLTAIVTWQDEVQGGEEGSRDSRTVAECVVDCEVAAFAVPGQPGEFRIPRRGDHFVIPENQQGTSRVKIEGNPMSDGSSRVLFSCSQVD